MVEHLDKLKISDCVGGSLASSLWGRQRATQDIDISVFMSAESARAFAESLPDSFSIYLDELLGLVDHPSFGGCTQLTHMDTVAKIDLFIVSPDPYHREQLARAVTS